MDHTLHHNSNHPYNRATDGATDAASSRAHPCCTFPVCTQLPWRWPCILPPGHAEPDTPTPSSTNPACCVEPNAAWGAQPSPATCSQPPLPASSSTVIATEAGVNSSITVCVGRPAATRDTTPGMDVRHNPSIPCLCCWTGLHHHNTAPHRK